MSLIQLILDLKNISQGDYTPLAKLIDERGRLYTICDLCVANEAVERGDESRLSALAYKILSKMNLASQQDFHDNAPQILAFLLTQWNANKEVISVEQYRNCIDLNY